VNHKEWLSPAPPIAVESDPEQAIPATQPWALLLALVDRQLLADRQILEDERLMATRTEPNHAKQPQDELKHGADCYPYVIGKSISSWRSTFGEGQDFVSHRVFEHRVLNPRFQPMIRGSVIHV
jgi:hypothetical protein